MNVVERVKKILLSPKEEWEVIKQETTTVKNLFTQYAVILAAIPAVAGLIGFRGFGMGSSFNWAIVTYVLSLVSAFALGYIIDVLAPTFGTTKDITSSMKVSVYASTASWVGGIFNLIPFLSFVSFFAGVYTLFLMYWGLKSIKEVPEDKMVGYFITVIVVSIVISLIIGAITSGMFLTGMALSGV